MKYKTPFIKPTLPDANEMSQAYEAIVASNWYSNFGPQEQKLSDGLSSYIGQGVSVTTAANATLALLLAVRALMTGKDPGRKKVLIPSFTFAAVPEALIWNSLEPVFIDIDATTWQPNIEYSRTYIETHKSEVAGILFCNIFGVGAPEIGEWEALANQHELPLVIDSAAGFGSQYADGSKLGARGDCEIFSFHVTKPFGVGEGAGISSKSKELIDRIRSLENFGFVSNREVQEVGLNAKMQEINAAIGLWQLGRIDSDIEQRRKVFTMYQESLTPLGYIFQPNAEQSTVCFVSVVAPDATKADAMYTALRNEGIEVNRYYNPALHKQRAFQSYDVAGSLDVTEDVCSRILSLPSHQEVDKNVVDIIASRLG